MNTVLLIVLAVTSVVGSAVSCFYAWLAYKRSKDRDELLDAAVRLFPHYQEFTGSIDGLGHLYAALRFIRDHPDADYARSSLEALMRPRSE